jgi:phage RecT family recombinase
MTTATAAPRRPEPLDPQEAGARMVALVEQRGYLGAILGSDPATVERFKTVLLSALTSSPKLLQADPATLVQAMREAAMWNLEPDGVDAVIVPYWNSKRSVFEADFQVTARGYVTVLYRSPRVLFVDADLIYENDSFEYEKGAVPRLVHRPNMFGDRGKRLGAYALVQLDTGFLRPIVLNEDAITSRRKRARDPEKGTWAEWPDEMARKTALRALMSLVPIERGVKAALATEDRKYPALAPVSPVPELSAGPAPEARPVPAIEAARAAFLPEPEPAEAPSEEPEPDEIVGEAIVAERIEAAKCGALSDPALGEIEECDMATGHLDVAGSQRRHRAASGSIWPAGKGGTA